MRYRKIVVRYVAKWGIAKMCLCEAKYQGRVSHHFGGMLTSLEKHCEICGIAAIVSQYPTIWGHKESRNISERAQIPAALTETKRTPLSCCLWLFPPDCSGLTDIAKSIKSKDNTKDRVQTDDTVCMCGVWLTPPKAPPRQKQAGLFSAQQVLNPTPLHPTPATCHKRKRKLHCSFRNAALQKLRCNIRFSAAQKSFLPKAALQQAQNCTATSKKLRCRKVALSCRFPAGFKPPRLGTHV